MVSTDMQQTTTTTTAMMTSVRPVVIEIHPKTISKPLLRKNLLLVLKSHRPTKWVVRTTGLRGTLDIVVSCSFHSQLFTLLPLSADSALPIAMICFFLMLEQL